MTPDNPVGNANQWYHLAVSRSGSAVRLYIDGQLINTINVAVPNITTLQPFAIGREAKGNQRNWEGQIDDLGMFDSALSIGHIASIHNVADTIGLDLNLGAMAGLFELHALGNGGGVVTAGGKQWTYDNSLFLAGLGAGGIGSSSGAFFLNFDGLSGVMEILPPPAPEPNSLILFAAGTILLVRRRRVG